MTVHHYADTRHTLAELAQRALDRCPHFFPGRLTAETRNDRVVLRGKVTSYYMKQLAQESLRGIEGLAGIQNEIEVRWV